MWCVQKLGRHLRADDDDEYDDDEHSGSDDGSDDSSDSSVDGAGGIIGPLFTLPATLNFNNIPICRQCPGYDGSI